MNRTNKRLPLTELSDRQKTNSKRTNKMINRNLLSLRVILMPFLFGIAFSASSQSTYAIKGIVKDQGDSLVFTNALLLDKQDSSLIKGSYVENGVILLEGITADTAILKIGSMDVQDTYFSIVRPEGNLLDLGELRVETGVLIDAVHVSAIRPAFVLGESGEIFINVKGSILESSTSLTDVLSKSPSIIVEDGTISVFGKGEAIVLLNGKLISGAQLQSIPVANIDHIEVLSNPPAKYDASGKAVVNVILTNNPLEGFQGEVVQNTTFARFLQSYTAFALNYRKNKLSLQGSYGQDIGRNWGTNVLTRESFSPLGTTTSINDFKDQSNLKYYNTYNLGFTYDFNQNNTLSLEYVGSSSTTDQDSEAATSFEEINGDETIINTENSGANKYLIQSINLNYASTLDTLGSNIFFGGQFFYFNSNNDNFIDEEIRSSGTTNLFNRKNVSSSLISFGTAQIDYQKYINKTSNLFEAGVKWIGADNAGVVDFFSKSSGSDDFTFVPALSNDFKYRENIGAIYTQYSTKLGEKSKLTVGARGEFTDADGFSNTLNQSIIDSSYFNIFPNIDWGYRFNNKWNANLSLSSSINRPSYQALDPFLFYVDSLTTNQGNPELRPEYTYSIESNIRYKRYSLKLGYNLSEDAFRYALLPGNNGQASSTLIQINVEREHSYFASLQIPLMYKKRIRSFNIIGATLDQVDDSRPEFASTAYIPRIYFFSNNIINFGKAGKLQLGFRLMGTRFDGLYYRRPFYNLSIGWSKSFMDDRLSLNFLADDIFHTNIVDGYYELASSRISYVRRMNTQLYRLTVRFTFGKLKEPGFSSKNVGTDSNNRIRR